MIELSHVEENILDSIKNLFNRTKDEHNLIGLLANGKSAIEKLLTDDTNPILTKEEFKANRSTYMKLVKTSISTVLGSPLDKEHTIYNIRYVSNDSEELYLFRMKLLDKYGDNPDTALDKLEDLKRTFDKYKKSLHTLEKKYTKEISETLNEKDPYSNLITKLKPMILKKTITFAINWANKRIEDDSFISGDDRTPFGRFIKEIRELEVKCLNIELKVIESAIKHNDSVANAIVSKIKSQIQKDLKPNIANESVILYELAMALEDL